MHSIVIALDVILNRFVIFVDENVEVAKVARV